MIIHVYLILLSFIVIVTFNALLIAKNNEIQNKRSDEDDEKNNALVITSWIIISLILLLFSSFVLTFMNFQKYDRDTNELLKWHTFVFVLISILSTCLSWDFYGRNEYPRLRDASMTLTIVLIIVFLKITDNVVSMKI